MTRRTRAAAILLVAPWALALVSCSGDGEIRQTLESALPSASSPTDEESGTQPVQDETEQPEPTQEESSAPPPEPTQSEEPPAPVETEAPDSTEDDSGLPPWAWILIIGVVVAGIAGLIAASRNRGGESDRDLAARADGQLSWVRNQVTDPLIRWRASQLGLPADQRDTDSAQAQTWAAIEDRFTSSGNDLLTLQSGAKDASIQQAAGMLQQSSDGFRNSLDALAASIATGDQARVSEATAAFQADVALFDQARQRLRQSAKLQ